VLGLGARRDGGYVHFAAAFSSSAVAPSPRPSRRSKLVPWSSEVFICPGPEPKFPADRAQSDPPCAQPATGPAQRLPAERRARARRLYRARRRSSESVGAGANQERRARLPRRSAPRDFSRQPAAFCIGPTTRRRVVQTGTRAHRLDSLRACEVVPRAARRWHAPRSGPDSMSNDSAIARAIRRRLSEQQRAGQQLQAVAKPYRFRVQADAEGFPIIPGRYGRIEWHCDGVNCWSCALPGQFALAVYTTRPRCSRSSWPSPA